MAERSLRGEQSCATCGRRLGEPPKTRSWHGCSSGGASPVRAAAGTGKDKSQIDQIRFSQSCFHGAALLSSWIRHVGKLGGWDLGCEPLPKIGSGEFLALGIHSPLCAHPQVAIKSIRKDKIKDEQDLVHIRREIEIMSSLNHPHIIAVHEVFENSSKIVIVMEYASKGDLYDYISERQRLSEQEARHFFRQVVSAVYYCHKNGVVHRDLKLENILLDANGNIKIADFGLSNVFQQDKLLQTYCGSPLYASPEIINGRPYKGPEVDSWSLGVLLYILVHGTMPFDGHDYKTLVKQITSGDYREPTKLSDACGLIRWMLMVNPERRGPIEDIATHWGVRAFSLPPTARAGAKL
ncbi:PREDICTED: NUAK family SNF1-like kinase 2 [Corvus brachyrhynchos]|uniref:NUAK family SNF1-like kinase 2 n=1 Tax=Corvus brachyrhynchos TaxID=85066 RepID=UPI0008165356|nr:PREDICTED: NUAK family SNF1-like kinase 2 [Corvus brachyrhynchos]